MKFIATESTASEIFYLLDTFKDKGLSIVYSFGLLTITINNSRNTFDVSSMGDKPIKDYLSDLYDASGFSYEDGYFEESYQTFTIDLDTATYKKGDIYTLQCSTTVDVALYEGYPAQGQVIADEVCY